MIICNHCGHVFEESEWGDYGECPKCGHDNTDEAEECPICGGYHSGYFDGNPIWCCPECFKKAFTPENFLKYATSDAEYDSEPDALEDFIMYEVFKLDSPLECSSYEFKEHCKKVYHDLEERGELRELINAYIADYPDALTNFTEWLVEEYKHNADMKQYFDEVTP